MVERTHLAPFHGAGLGVDLFFMLSGFLISGPLLAGFQRSGGLDIRRFYWHFPVFAFAQRQLGRSLKSLLVELPVTLLLAYGSYRLVERPFLRARERLPSTQQEPAVRGEFAVLTSAAERP
jgi:peptidoglycan/LPS O-acetylase OafA/YrhL